MKNVTHLSEDQLDFFFKKIRNQEFQSVFLVGEVVYTMIC